jgi:hypothetical protein
MQHQSGGEPEISRPLAAHSQENCNEALAPSGQYDRGVRRRPFAISRQGAECNAAGMTVVSAAPAGKIPRTPPYSMHEELVNFLPQPKGSST